MKLLTEELRRRLPPLYSQENTKDPTVVCKFFTPDSSWTWLATEGSEEENDFRFFGYVIGLEEECGYFVLSEARIGPRPPRPADRTRSLLQVRTLLRSHQAVPRRARLLTPLPYPDFWSGCFLPQRISPLRPTQNEHPSRLTADTKS